MFDPNLPAALQHAMAQLMLGAVVLVVLLVAIALALRACAKHLSNLYTLRDEELDMQTELVQAKCRLINAKADIIETRHQCLRTGLSSAALPKPALNR